MKTISELGRITAGAYYDHQEVRIKEMHRIRDVIRKKIEGIKPTEVEKKKKKEDKYKKKFKDTEIPKYLEMLIKDKKLTEKESNYIKKMMEIHKQARKHEVEYKKLMDEYVESEDIYMKFLQHIRGISSVLSCNLIKEFGYCENAPNISSLWKYCGMHVVNGESPKRKKGQKLDFNLRLRSLCWKIGDSFVKQRTPFYRDIYDKEKARQLKLMEKPTLSRKPDELSVPKNKLHADLRSRRKMVKIFLAHYWMACKELSHENIENHIYVANKPYVESKLKHKHISNWNEAVKENKAIRKKKTTEI